MINSLDHLIIAVNNLDEAENNYKKIFGMEPVWRGEHKELGTSNSLFNFNNTYFELLSATGAIERFSPKLKCMTRAHSMRSII